MKARGYSQYRGRKTWLHYVLSALAVILALALVAAVVALLAFPDQARQLLPALPSAEPTPIPSDELDDILVIEPSSAPSSAPSPTPTPSMSPRRAAPLGLVSVGADALLGGSAAQILQSGQGAVVAMKPASGKLPFVLDSAPDAANGSDRSAAETFRQANASLNYSVAYVSCFLDEAVTDADPSLALKASGVQTPWLDEEGRAWLDPANETVQAYLIALCESLAGMGFDEILLDHAGYPAASLADADALTAFYASLRAALDALGYQGRLSVVSTQDVFERSADAATGQTLSAVARRFERVYLAAGIPWSSGTNVYRLLQGAGFTGSTGDIVTVVKKPISASYAWAVLTEG